MSPELWIAAGGLAVAALSTITALIVDSRRMAHAEQLHRERLRHELAIADDARTAERAREARAQALETYVVVGALLDEYSSEFQLLFTDGDRASSEARATADQMRLIEIVGWNTDVRDAAMRVGRVLQEWRLAVEYAERRRDRDREERTEDYKNEEASAMMSVKLSNEWLWENREHDEFAAKHASVRESLEAFGREMAI